ncbi:GNAT family N-acetyltransferase [Streptomyces sp. ME02-8801-2C]|uniref:GNAT family N-acetyltransferase n=1 Tax=Streptomyces sp. ME02-8801-2C TaxID=3028680 RepID=UPI0029B4B84F|nr:GNAT family N-acetyltransferase [Streptomyces sp. ME02-8801-2C]MDX3455109.1 GNAT family N-acetyltransferase [Streptomyces sp. ME02-8801-2C]
MNDDIPAFPEGYECSTDPARIDVERVHRWLSTDAYWALGRPREKFEDVIAHSLNFGVYDATSGEQVAYARVVTDQGLFAWLCDVYVDRSVRGTGVGTAMVREARDHLGALGVRRILLATSDAHGVYEKIGFRPLAKPEQWMALYFE